MTQRFPLWTCEPDGDPVYSAVAMWIATDAPMEAVAEFVRGGWDWGDLPADWRRSMTRRFLEAQAHGSLQDNIPAAIVYWASKIGVVEHVDLDAWVIVE